VEPAGALIWLVGELKRMKISQLEEGFYNWCRYEKRRRASEQTLITYKNAIQQVKKIIGDMNVELIIKERINHIKRTMFERGVKEARVSLVMYAMRSFIRYCREIKLKVISPTSIIPPDIPKREVIYLTPEEIRKFIGSIDMTRRRGYDPIHGLRFRTFVEVLLGTAARIGEALSLNKEDINFNTKEAQIIGKGNKERTIFFTDRALRWIKKYLKAREDDCPALFVAHCQPRRWQKKAAEACFERYRDKAGIKKKITAQIIRHTAATLMKFHGCDLLYLKEILGHENLETTEKFYLGVDKRMVKKVHKKYLIF